MNETSVTYPLPEHDEQLYVKRRGRYVPVVANLSFPCDGVWLVQHSGGGKSSRCIRRPTVTVTHLADLPDPLPLARIELHRDAIIRALHRKWRALRAMLHEKNSAMLPCLSDLASEIIRTIEEEERASTRKGDL